MSSNNTPADGDFATYLARREASSRPGEASPQPEGHETEQDHGAAVPSSKQSIEDVLVRGEEPTEAFLEEFSELQAVPALSDDELAKQALEHPGNDGDPSTPE